MLIEEGDLDVAQFRCCGDEDLYPLACPSCGHAMIFCYECDTLYSDLNNLSDTATDINNFNPQEPIFSCPRCKYEFPYYFMRDGLYKVERTAWLSAGLEHLLRKRQGA